MIAADHAVCWLLMTLSAQIKLWMINFGTESMHGAGFIRGSLTSDASTSERKATRVAWGPPLFPIDIFSFKQPLSRISALFVLNFK